jgi:hypothetical protein
MALLVAALPYCRQEKKKKKKQSIRHLTPLSKSALIIYPLEKDT